MKKSAVIFLIALLISVSGFTQTIEDIDYISPFEDGVAAIKKGSKWAIINTDGVIVNYPNSLLSSGIIKNFSINSKPVRARVRFQVDYSSDPDRVRSIVMEATSKVPGILQDQTS